ncbi:MAG: hypothetical protein WBP12_05250 [Candidatus Saccharimonas sp.]
MSIDAEYSSKQPTIDSPLHEVLDPDRRIPTDYSIESQAESEWFDGRGHTVRWRIFHDSDSYDPIAHCNLNVYTNNGDNNYVCFDGVKIDDQDFQGQGYGLAMYLEAIIYAHSLNLPFRTQDWNQTEHAVRIWTALHKLGIAREVTPFVFHRMESRWDQDEGKSYKEPRYKGHYVVDVPMQTSAATPLQ